MANFSCTAKLKETHTNSKLFIPTQNIKLKAKRRVFIHLIPHIESTVVFANSVTKDTCARWAVNTRSDKKLRLEDEPLRLLDEYVCYDKGVTHSSRDRLLYIVFTRFINKEPIKIRRSGALAISIESTLLFVNIKNNNLAICIKHLQSSAFISHQVY